MTIETQPVVLDEDHCDKHDGFVPGDFCMLAVSDDGCGFGEDVRDMLFDPFFTTKEDGTGLGLAMVYGIVKQNKGFISVYSEPGEGTTFKIYLPRHGGETKPEVVPDVAADTAGGGGTILIAEDDPVILKLAKLVLAKEGHEVVCADSPGDAVAYAERHPGKIDLLITDVVMPGTNGRELAQLMERFHPDLKVLFMSGYTANVIAHRGALDEDINFLQKPFRARELAQKVRSVLDDEPPR